MSTTTSPYLAAANRAHIIAAIARDRFAPSQTLDILRRIARHLEEAAEHFAAYKPLPALAAQDLPFEASEELRNADTLAYDNPATRLPAEFTEYVLQPVTGRRLPFPDPMNPRNDRFAEQEKDLRSRLTQLHDDTARAAEDPDEWLRAVLTVWQQLMRLADKVRVDNTRPCNQAKARTSSIDYTAAADTVAQALQLIDKNEDFDNAREAAGDTGQWPTELNSAVVRDLRGLRDRLIELSNDNA